MKGKYTLKEREEEYVLLLLMGIETTNIK